MMNISILDSAEQMLKSGKLSESFSSQEMANIVIDHACGAGWAAMAAGFFPGVGSIVASGIAVGTIWSMYYRISKYLDLNIGKNIWKILASATVSNLVTQLGGALVFDFITSFIPGLGIITNGLVNFGVTYVAGKMFFEALTRIFKAGYDPNTMTSSQMKEEFKHAVDKEEVNRAFSEAKNLFDEMRKDGTLQEKGTDDNLTNIQSQETN